MQDTNSGSRTSPDTAYPLNRNSAVPLYHQLFIDLRRRLLAGEWQPGDPFPKDSAIEQAYNVSRITVRQAVANLVDGNFVVRYRGKGSFVGNLPRDGARTNHATVSSEIAEIGRTASHKNLSLEFHEVSDLTAKQLDIPIGAEIAVLKRLHFGNGDPICLEAVMLATASYPNIFERVMNQNESLADAYTRFNINVAKCEQTVHAVMLSDERRNQLKLDRDTPALMVERVGYSATNRPLELRHLYYRSDLYALRQEIIWGAADTRIM